MNYKKIYDTLVSRGQSRTLTCYKESHHIIPRCMGGSNNPDNLVDLTPEEHYVAHQLLVKIYPDNPKLIFAAHMMCQGRPGNKFYGWLRRRHAKTMSELNSKNTGEKNGAYGKMWITDGIESKKIKKDQDIPEGWYKGRGKKYADKVRKTIFKNKFIFPKHIQKCQKCLNKEYKEKAIYWYNKFINSDCISIREFVRNSDYPFTNSSFVRMLKNNIPEFNPKKSKPYKHKKGDLIGKTSNETKQKIREKQMCKIEHVFKHIETGNIFIGNKTEFRLKFGLLRGSVHRITKKINNTHRGWKCLGLAQ